MAFPASLYKYVSFLNKDFLHEIIVQSKVFFTSPNNFNDPFDCKPNFLIGNSESEIEQTREFLFQMSEGYTPLNEKMRRVASNLIVSAFSDNEFRMEYQKTIANRGVYCLAKKQNSLLMWSHYGDGHNGLCLEFTTEPNGSFFSNAKPVRYTSSYPILASHMELEDIGDSTFLIKSKEWEYEQEFRLISNYLGHLVFPKELLVGITFGCKVSDENVAMAVFFKVVVV